MINEATVSPKISKRRKRGIALPFAMVMMALLMLFGITFLIASTNDKILATAQSNDSAARLLAEAAIYRAKTVLGLNVTFQVGNISLINPSSHAMLCASKHSELLRSPFFSMATPNERQYVLGNKSIRETAGELVEGLNRYLFLDPFHNENNNNKTQLSDFYQKVLRGKISFSDNENASSFSYAHDDIGPQWNYITTPYSVDALHKTHVQNSDEVRLIGRIAFIGFMGGKISLPFFLSEDYQKNKKIERKGTSPYEIRPYLGLRDFFLNKQTGKDVSFNITSNSEAQTIFNQLAHGSGKYLGRSISRFPDIFAFARALKEVAPNKIQIKDALALSNVYSIIDNATYELWRMTDYFNGGRPYFHRFNIARNNPEHTTDPSWDQFFNQAGEKSPFSSKLAVFQKSFSGPASPVLFRDGEDLRTVNTSGGPTAGLHFFNRSSDYEPFPMNVVGYIQIPNRNVSGLNVRRTLYANLRDYLDEDDETTCLIEGNNVQFAGLEKAPLVNEFAFEIECSKESLANPDDGFSYQVNLNKVQLELVDMFKCDFFEKASPYIYLDIDILFGDNVEKIKIDGLKCTKKGGSQKYPIYAPSRGADWNKNFTARDDRPIRVRVNYCRAEIYGGKSGIALTHCTRYNKEGLPLSQVAQPIYNGASLELPVNPNEVVTLTEGEVKSLMYGFEATDPRCRFTADGWAGYFDNNTGAKLGSIGESNKIIKNGGDRFKITYEPRLATTVKFTDYFAVKYVRDAETADELHNVSTAYISNRGYFEAPIELGLIHRMHPWQTLNLKTMPPGSAYVNVKAFTGDNIYSGGIKRTANLGAKETSSNSNMWIEEFESTELSGEGVSYIDMSENGYQRGDAGIMDQVKWGQAVKTYGKINYYVASEGVVRALFMDLPIYKLNRETGVFEVSETITSDEILKKMAPNLITPLTNRRFFRGSYANAIHRAIWGFNRVNNTYTGPIFANQETWTDMQLESLFANVALLIEPESGRDASVLVVAQSIDDRPDKNGDYATFTDDDVISGQARLFAQFEFAQFVNGIYHNIANYSAPKWFARTTWLANDWVLRRIIYLDPSL